MSLHSNVLSWWGVYGRRRFFTLLSICACPVPNLRKARNGNNAHETGRIKRNCEFISPKLRIHFAKTANSLRQNCEMAHQNAFHPTPSSVPAMPYGQPSATRSASAATSAPLAAGMPHGLERLRHVARALVRKLPHRRLKHGRRDHEPHPSPTRLRLLRQNRERRPRSEVIDSGPAW